MDTKQTIKQSEQSIHQNINHTQTYIHVYDFTEFECIEMAKSQQNKWDFVHNIYS